MRDRAITGGMLLGLACFVAAVYAFVSRNTGPCGIPETCRVPGALNPHPYTGYGYVLAAVGLTAFGVAIFLAARRRTPD